MGLASLRNNLDPKIVDFNLALLDSDATGDVRSFDDVMRDLGSFIRDRLIILRTLYVLVMVMLGLESVAADAAVVFQAFTCLSAIAIVVAHWFMAAYEKIYSNLMEAKAIAIETIDSEKK